MFESTRLIITDALYILAYLITASVYLFWNDLLLRFWTFAVFCLSDPSSPLLLSLLKLHCLVLASFVLATCFRATTAATAGMQYRLMMPSEERGQVLGFDDIPTDKTGFGSFATAYHHLVFNGLYPFDPAADAFSGRISPHDLNCAVSAPNELYRARYGTEGSLFPGSTSHGDVPAFSVNVNSTAKAGLEGSFTLHGMKIKPLDFPLSHTTLYLRGYGAGNEPRTLEWQVNFPLGFHEMLHVKIEEFSKVRWEALERVEVFADLHYDGGDWEFCLDDLEVGFTAAAAAAAAEEGWNGDGD